MKNTISCKKCGTEIEISEAFAHQIEEQIRQTLLQEHNLKLEKAVKNAEQSAVEKIKKDFESQLRSSIKEKEEEKERVAKLLREQELLQDEKRKLLRRDEERALEMKKQLIEEEEKIRREATKKAEEAQDLKLKEREHMIEQLKKSLEDAQRKASQSSQQLQGEILELEVEDILRHEFPTDKITEVKKGQRGADTLQEVIDKKGNNCGSILWESKNAQWTESWISKLKEDQRQAKADFAVLVVEKPPQNIKGYDYKEGVWISTRKLVSLLSLALRFDLIRINYERSKNVGKNEKMEILYSYINSLEFKHRIEAIIESFSNMQSDIEKERRWYTARWAKQEKQLRRLIDHTHGMWGDLQGVVGKTLPDIQPLPLDTGDIEDETEK